MSTQFSDAEEALGLVRAMFGLDGDITFEKIETEPIMGIFSDTILDKAKAPDADESDKVMAKSILDRMAAQETYRPMKDGAEYEFPLKARKDEEGGEKDPEESPGTVKVHFTIGPFRSGVDCWAIDTRTGMANRL